MNRSGLALLAVDHHEGQMDDLVRTLRANPRVRGVETGLAAHEALVRASRRRFDAVFVDVSMPGLERLEIASVLNAFARPPSVVFVAGSDRYVASAFRLGAVDFLIKPVTPERLEEALERVEAATADGAPGEDPRGDAKGAGEAEPDRQIVAVDNGSERGTRLLVPRSILYVQAYGDYIRIFADSGRYLVRGRLADAAARLAADGFLRVHRTYLANLRRAIEVQTLQNGTAVLLLEDDRQVPVARRHVRELRQRIRSEHWPLIASPPARRQACRA